MIIRKTMTENGIQKVIEIVINLMQNLVKNEFLLFFNLRTIY
jgi:hypothetical protein